MKLSQSNELTIIHYDDNKSRHYQFYCRGRNIFVRWKNNLWSFYVLLRTLENNNTPRQKHMSNWKAPSVINLMGFAYFTSLTRSRQKKSHGIWKRSSYKTHSGLRVHVKTDVVLQSSAVIKKFVDFKVKASSRAVWCRIKVKKIINQIIIHNMLIWTLLHLSFVAALSLWITSLFCHL